MPQTLRPETRAVAWLDLDETQKAAKRQLAVLHEAQSEAEMTAQKGSGGKTQTARQGHDLLEQSVSRAFVVGIVRTLLGRGLSPAFMKSCVRLGDFVPFGGGMKADMIGGLRIDIAAVLKKGDDELDKHKAMMEFINRRKEHVFANVLECFQLPDENGRLLVLEELRQHSSLLNLTYDVTQPTKDFENIVRKTVAHLNTIHAVRARSAGKELSDFPHTQDPYGGRLRAKLQQTIEGDSQISCMWDCSGTLMKRACPPVATLLDALRTWLRDVMPGVEPALVHGDPHLGNIMVRQRRRGYSVHLIDPNPSIGFSDPVYDVGKLLHWAEPVGWAKKAPDACNVRWSRKGRAWTLEVSSKGAARVERQRVEVQRVIHGALAHLRCMGQANAAARLDVARASAHVGMASLLSRTQTMPARFAIAHAVSALLDWYERVALEKSIKGYEGEIATVMARFDADKKRWRELKQLQSDGKMATPDTATAAVR